MERPPTPEEAAERRRLHRLNTQMANQDSQFGVDWETGRDETQPRAADVARAAIAKARAPKVEPEEKPEEERPDLTVQQEYGGGTHLTPAELDERRRQIQAEKTRQLRKDIARDPEAPQQEAS